MSVAIPAGLLIGAALVVIGGVFQLLGFRESRTRSSWPKVTAVVLGQDLAHQGRFGIDYCYMVGERQFQGHLYSNKPQNFEAIDAKYDVGVELDIFYNPAKQSHSEARDPLVKTANWTPYITGYLFDFAAFLILLFVFVFANPKIG